MEQFSGVQERARWERAPSATLPPCEGNKEKVEAQPPTSVRVRPFRSNASAFGDANAWKARQSAAAIHDDGPPGDEIELG